MTVYPRLSSKRATRLSPGSRFKASSYLFLVLSTLALVAGCGGGQSASQSSRGLEFETAEAGVLQVGTEFPYPPFEYREGDQPVGFDVELLQAMGGDLQLETEFVNIPFDTLFAALAADKFDVGAAAFTMCVEPGSEFENEVEQRKQSAIPTDPYYIPEQTLFINSSGDSAIQSSADIGEGTRVGVLRGTAWVEYAEQTYGTRGADVVTFGGNPDMIIALRSGSIDVGLDDLALVQFAQNEDPDIELIEPIEAPQKYNFAVSKDNPGLAKALDESLSRLVEDGTYERIFEKYFPDQELPAASDLSDC